MSEISGTCRLQFKNVLMRCLTLMMHVMHRVRHGSRNHVIQERPLLGRLLNSRFAQRGVAHVLALGE